MRKGILWVAGACALALFAVGCGGSGSGGEVSETSISKNDYISKADAICEESVKRIKTDFGVYLKEQQGGAKRDPAQTNRELLDTVLKPNIEREVEELRALGAPKGEAGAVEKLLRTREEVVTLAERDPTSITTNKPFEKWISAAKRYGVLACAVP